VSRILDVDEVDAALKRAAERATTGTREERSGRILILSAEYDEKSRELRVTFTNGKTYTYRNVPREIYDGLRKAESKSEFVAQQIKDQFAFSEVRDQTKSA
jgi:KTSC domain